MAIIVNERFGQRRSDDSATVVYLVENAANAAAARSAAISAAPSTYDGLPQTGAQAREFDDDAIFEVEVLYGDEDLDPPVDTIADSFEVAITPTQVFTSRETVSTHAPFDPFGPALPDFQGAINVDSDDRVNGVQWPPSTPQVISRNKVVDSSLVTEAYFRTMSGLVGHVNSTTFLGFNAGEVLFLGSTGTRRGVASDDPWDITWKFAISLNATNVPIGSEITISSKTGWHYVWTHYRPRKDSTAKMLIPRPVAAYVEQIAPESDFAGLIL